MRFHAPLLLWMTLPWLLACLVFARTQQRALGWVIANISERFRSRFSVHTPASLGWHLTLLAAMGLLLIVAAARPYRPGEAEIEAERSRVVLIFDASASMYATDAGEGETPKNRFELAREAAALLIESLPDTSFALVSFSGSAAIHTPMSGDRGFLADALRGLEIHGQYQTTGSSFTRALDTILDFQDPTRPNLQAVFFSDGEQPVEEDVDEALAALAGQGVAIHTLGIGTTEGQNRVIYDFRDIVAKKEEPAVLLRYTTRRIDELLEQIAKTTGGHFEVLDSGSVVRVAEAISDHDAPAARIESRGTGTDLGVYCLLGFLLAWMADGLLIGRKPRHTPIRFEVGRLGGRGRRSRRAASWLLVSGASMLLSACADSPRARAYRENEQGIALDALSRFDEARVHYKRAISYGVRPEVPTYNLARSVHREGDVSAAHELYQEALKLDPRLPEAFYNDGVALWQWGEAQRDPKGCELERTRELWSRALQRFARAVGLTKTTQTTGRMARNNHAHLESALEKIEELIENPPPECPGGGGGGGSNQNSGGGGGSGGEDENQQSQGGGGGGGEDEEDQDQGGEGGGQNEDPENQGGGGGSGQPENEGDDPQGGGGSGEDQENQGGGGTGQPEGEGDSPAGGGGAGDDQEDQGGGGGGQPEGEGDNPAGGGGPGDDQENQGGGGGSGDDREDQGGGGSGDSREGHGGGGGGGSPPPLSPGELEQIRAALDRIGQQGFEPGKFHRRTLPEQFGEEHWGNPDRVIWW